MRGMRRTVGLVAAAAVTVAIAACGDTGSPRGSAGTPASRSQDGIPDVLAGTWEATIQSSRLKHAPADLIQERSVWRLKVLGTGGEDNGPSLFLSNEEVGEIAHSISLSGDRITLQSDTDCKRFIYVEVGPEKIQIRSTEHDEGCPSTLISSVLQGTWRLVEGGPSRREPVTAEGSLASKEAFVECARRRDELGLVVGFRGGRAVPEPGQDIDTGVFDDRVSAPQAIADALEDGAQYVGLREGVGPDVDIMFQGRPPGGEREAYILLFGRVIEEAIKKGVVSSNLGDYSALAGSQEFVTVRLEGSPPGWDENLGALRVPRALKHLVPCFRQAVQAADRLVPAPGPLAGVWRTDLITVDDMSRTLRDHGLARWIGRFAKHAPIGKTPTALVLEIDTRGNLYPLDWQLFAEPGRVSRKTMIDYRVQAESPEKGPQYEQDGDRLVVSYEGESNTYRWSVDGRYLTLTWQKTTYPPHMGIPEEVFQRALYMTAKFKRVG